ncbi:MAG: hypothetical protein KTR33_09210 [Gammaproteobacteria bacterium]|nr:hypothetical protein [Gammaproteobacteria bacterium]
MQVNTSSPVSVVSTCLTATLENVSQRVGDLPMQLYDDLEQQRLEPKGPMVFVYRGVDGNPNTEFELEITLPVDAEAARDNYQGKFEIKRVEAFRHVETEYAGPVSAMSKEGYEPLFTDLSRSGLAPDGQCREVYDNWVNPESDENRIRIQVGVQSG